MISLEEESQPTDIAKPTNIWNPTLLQELRNALEELRNAYETPKWVEWMKCLSKLFIYTSPSGLPRLTWLVTHNIILL